MPAKTIVPIGTRFGQLRLQAILGQEKGHRMWECLCDCGQLTVVLAGNVKRGLTKSCGCYRRQHSAALLTIHGMKRTPEYGIWSKMKGRCLTPTDAAYDQYGRRGITVFGPWIDDFMEFYRYIGPRPTSAHTIERINNNEGYEPGNVKWATRKEQNRNKRNTTWLTLNGVTLCSAEWTERLNIKRGTIWYRKQLGWSDEKILTHPLHAKS